MRYRLICVVDIDNPMNGIKIEVGIDSASKSLIPFKRNITVDELIKSGDGKENAIAYLLFGLGFTVQPFQITYVQSQNATVQNVIEECSWAYVRRGEKGSLKRIKSLTQYLPQPIACSYPMGKLISGELYVSSLQNWNENLKIRFRYQDCTRIFPIVFGQVPYQAENRYYVRDINAERCLVDMLDREDVNKQESTATINNIESIKDLLKNGWKLYVQKTPQSHSSLVFKSDNGIDWFGAEGSSSPLEEREMLHAFLKGKDYMQSDGDIVLINKNSISKASSTEISSILFPELDIRRLFNNSLELSLGAKEKIGDKIENDVNAILKPYQIDGVYWLWKMRQKGVGCLLADEMGLGKTLQVLSYFITLPLESIFLVVCPASVISNWEKEIMKFTPSLKGKIEVASYDNVRLNTEVYKRKEYDTLVLDESQLIKNSSTKRFQAVSELNRKHTIILSGTPIENNVQELWSQFKVIIPEARMLEKEINKIGPTAEAFIDLSKKILSHFILRRTKKDVKLGLPALNEHEIRIELSEEERRIYDRIRKIFLTGVKTGVTGRASFLALECLTRLRQCCVSSNMVPEHITQTGKFVSTKMSEAISFTEKKLSGNHRLIIFSQFAKALHELRSYLEDKGISSLILTGETINRQRLIDRFQSNCHEKVFLISLKAGGAGINLTAADTVLFLDDWWNPSVENQAKSRAHRMGQTKETNIYRIICRDTVEEKILELHQEKNEIADLFHTENAQLSFEEIKNLIL